MAHCRVASIVGFAAVAAAGGLAAETLVVSGPTMGTAYHVKLVGVAADDEVLIRRGIEAVLDDVDRRLSTYRADSEISRFNRAPAGKWFAVSPDTVAVVAFAQEISERSGGALDITVGPLVRLWHFGPNAISDAELGALIAPPEDKALRAAQKLVGHQKLKVRDDPPALLKQVDGLEIDLSAVGEGDAVDRLAAMIAARGIKNFLIELGGEVRTAGVAPSGATWRVAVQRPTDEQIEVQATVPLTNAALATSGDYRRFFENAGRRYAHVINPATAQPIRHSLASVTVAADQCLTADAWATALLVLGQNRGYDCAVKHDLAALLVSRKENRTVVQETPAWKERFPAVARDPATVRSASHE